MVKLFFDCFLKWIVFWSGLFCCKIHLSLISIDIEKGQTLLKEGSLGKLDLDEFPNFRTSSKGRHLEKFCDFVPRERDEIFVPRKREEIFVPRKREEARFRKTCLESLNSARTLKIFFTFTLSRQTLRKISYFSYLEKGRSSAERLTRETWERNQRNGRPDPLGFLYRSWENGERNQRNGIP